MSNCIRKFTGPRKRRRRVGRGYGTSPIVSRPSAKSEADQEIQRRTQQNRGLRPHEQVIVNPKKVRRELRELVAAQTEVRP